MFSQIKTQLPQWLLRLISLQRFSLRFKLICIVPTLFWLVLFKASSWLPNDARPPIDVTTLPKLENWILFGNSLQHFPRDLVAGHEAAIDFFDLFAGFFYLFHFASAWIFAIILYLYYRNKREELPQPWTFLWSFGLMNALSVIIQLAWPTAPPWYVEEYGLAPANYSIKGSPAELSNADHILNIPLFATLYGNSPIVFGSWPSLHGAWPIIIVLFIPKLPRLAFVWYPLALWWSAMYLAHHWFVDLLGSALVAFFSYFIGRATIRLMKTRLLKRDFETSNPYKSLDDSELLPTTNTQRVPPEASSTQASASVVVELDPVPEELESFCESLSSPIVALQDDDVEV